MTRYFKIYILFLFFSLAGFSQISKVHYIPPLTSNKSIAGGSSIPLDQYMYLSTPSENNVTVTVTPLFIVIGPADIAFLPLVTV